MSQGGTREAREGGDVLECNYYRGCWLLDLSTRTHTLSLLSSLQLIKEWSPAVWGVLCGYPVFAVSEPKEKIITLAVWQVCGVSLQ